jgi:disulfide bond formation protein DsbB
LTDGSFAARAFGRLLHDRRLGNLAGFLACAGLMGYALFAEHVLGFEPCPLCIFQRVGIIALGITFLIAALHHPASTRGARVYGVLLLVVSAFPGYVAGRHVYIQSLPFGSVPACGASLDYMMDVFPFMTVLRKVLFGAGECQTIDWSFLGLSMPAWVLISVIALASWAALVNLRASQNASQ